MSCQWLIPAHAGKTGTRSAVSSGRWAHPRSRGENASRARRRAARSGSSPLTRGKRREVERTVTTTRLIPAHAGKTREAGTSRMPSRAHPRSRGDNTCNLGIASQSTGSSPLTRGKRLKALAIDRRSGLIPAHAGKTERRDRLGRSNRAHPRSRGENSSDAACSPGSPGSSPLTRGKLWVASAGEPSEGLIPAHAGKTPASYPGPGPAPAHPRSRGENTGPPGPRSTPAGSSPLTRGKQRFHEW